MAVIRRVAGPVILTTSLGTNIYNQGSALIYDVVRNIHISNKTANPARVSLWVGLTGANTAGTELFIGKTVLANDYIDWPFPFPMKSVDFLVGGSDTAAALTIVVVSEQLVVP